MPIPRLRPFRSELLLAVVAGLVLLAGCTIHESREGGEKKVDIQTPFASLNVNTDASANDTGLPVYPGARRKPGSAEDKHAANVNISTGAFGLKLAVVSFESDDPPEKVLGFYRDKMKAFGGTYLECRDSYVDLDRDQHSDELRCGKHGHDSGAVELKAGTKERQHVVAVKPRGSGSEFTLVYVQTHGKEGAL